jgi:hypothetical protein
MPASSSHISGAAFSSPELRERYKGLIVAMTVHSERLQPP